MNLDNYFKENDHARELPDFPPIEDSTFNLYEHTYQPEEEHTTSHISHELDVLRQENEQLKYQLHLTKKELAKYKTKLPMVDIVNAFRSGVSLSGLGRQYGKDKNTIKKHLLKVGITESEFQSIVQSNKQHRAKPDSNNMSDCVIDDEELPF